MCFSKHKIVGLLCGVGLGDLRDVAGAAKGGGEHGAELVDVDGGKLGLGEVNLALDNAVGNGGLPTEDKGRGLEHAKGEKERKRERERGKGKDGLVSDGYKGESNREKKKKKKMKKGGHHRHSSDDIIFFSLIKKYI
jgi:hypothetical protein